MRSIAGFLSRISPKLTNRTFIAGLAAYSSGDFRKALVELQPLAEQGNSSAQAILGRIYYNGHGVPVDFVQAEKWTRLAANAGVPEAQFNLGCMYDCGDGLVQDIPEAICWYRRAAQWGFLNAQINLSNCFRNGSGLGQDESMAACWIKIAADQGDIDAQLNLAIRYLHGIGVSQNLREAYFWLSLAKEKGSTDAISYIDDLLLSLTPDQILLIEGFKKELNWKPKSPIESGFEVFRVSAVQNVETLKNILGDQDFQNLKIIDKKIPSIGEIILAETHGLRFPTIANNIKEYLAGIERTIDSALEGFSSGKAEKLSVGTAISIIRRLDDIADVGTILGDIATDHVHNLLEYHLALIGALEERVNSSFLDTLLKRFALKQGLRAQNLVPYAGLHNAVLPLVPWQL